MLKTNRTELQEDDKISCLSFRSVGC